MAILYLTEQGATLRKDSERILVEKEKRVLLEVPVFKVEKIFVFGNIHLTTPAISFLLQKGIDTCFFTIHGRFKGRLTPLDSKNVILRINQYKRYQDNAFKLSLAKKIVKNKIKNQLALLQRYQRNHPEADFSTNVDKIRRNLESLDEKTRLPSVIGVEGVAAAVYFDSFAKMFRKALRFKTRSRRPPADPVNAVLSFGYSLITSEIFSLLSGMGFDPYIGYLHSIEYGRPSLALDVLEEFRQPIIDRLTLSLFNKTILDPDDFTKRDGGVYLKKNALKTFFLHYEKYLQRSLTLQGEKKTVRSIFKYQMQRLADIILNGNSYEPFSIHE